jgi:predicted transcriptional regulator YheO
MKKTREQQLLIDNVTSIAEGLGATFAPFCEVVVHDLLSADHTVVAIHNNLSGREVGQPATELGLARIADDAFPQVIANYSNQFPDGRQVKSTSIGIKDSSGRYIAALCINVDLSLFGTLQNVLSQFSTVDKSADVQESLDPMGADAIRKRIDQFAASRATSVRALKTEDRRALMKELSATGLLDIRKSTDIVSAHLGVSRATVYNDVK